MGAGQLRYTLILLIDKALGGVVALLDPSLHPLVNLALQPCNGLRSQPDRLRELALAHEEVDVGAAVARSCNHFGQAEELSWSFHNNSFLEGVENPRLCRDAMKPVYLGIEREGK